MRRSVPRRVIAPLISVRTWATGCYLLGGLPLGVAWWTLLGVGFGFGAGLAVALVGLPVLLLTLAAGRSAAGVERVLAHRLLGTHVDEVYRAPVRSGLRGWSRAVVTDPATWRDLLFLVLRLPIGLIEGALLATVWSVGWLMLLAPLPQAVISGAIPAALQGRRLLADDGLPKAFLLTAAGLVLLTATSHLVPVLGRAHGRLATALLGPSRGSRAYRLRLELDEERRQRSATVAIAAHERRRIERDLHDGAQQHLVKLAMDLGMALRKIDTQPEVAKRMVGDARDRAVETLEEIRALAAGLHPAILAEQGLDAAMSALAGRCPVPVDTRVECDHRPDAETETAAYFVVAEALTNIARHAGATRARVIIRCTGGWLAVEVHDDGRGGADPSRGTGLTGLRDRVAALSGTLDIDGPPGGPTIVRAELPCGS
ncbi:sensor histidine kinase [Streptomyces sp. NPDC006641]|uniref:sensor histidine kinase n=1 Tax=unclassified Streptomyces TaxID=2593676 RepID=UPI002E77E999|nr:sensor histidine kinase [Streptomyces sp. JV184]MEE1748900.1 sensor histidine kinase [Streptomyces sp. JV184]